jgi:FHA domain
MQQRETTEAVRLVLSSGELVLRSIPMLKERQSIGRRPYNDIALDDLTVSGEHAVILKMGDFRVIRDLKSRNGTLLNGRLVAEQALQDGDVIDIGIYRLKFVLARPSRDAEDASREAPATNAALIETLNGPQAGTQLRLERAITSIGNTGTQVAVVARRRNGYYVTHLEGMSFPLVNGESIGLMAFPLAQNDLIELGGTMMRFRFKS